MPGGLLSKASRIVARVSLLLCFHTVVPRGCVGPTPLQSPGAWRVRTSNGIVTKLPALNAGDLGVLRRSPAAKEGGSVHQFFWCVVNVDWGVNGTLVGWRERRPGPWCPRSWWDADPTNDVGDIRPTLHWWIRCRRRPNVPGGLSIAIDEISRVCVWIICRCDGGGCGGNPLPRRAAERRRSILLPPLFASFLPCCNGGGKCS